jgi:hypothetical protein
MSPGQYFRRKKEKLNGINNQEAGKIQVHVAMLTKFSSKTPSLVHSHAIHSVKANPEPTCLASGDTDSCEEPLGSA